MNRYKFISFIVLLGILVPSSAQAQWLRKGVKAVQAVRVPLQSAVRRGGNPFGAALGHPFFCSRVSGGTVRF